MTHGIRILVLGLLVVAAGCSGFTPSETTTSSQPTEATSQTAESEETPTTTSTAVPPNQPADPPTDQIGWENGYWHNESISVTPSDGFNDSERAKILARTMARVEVIRGLEFQRNVTLRVISREELREIARDLRDPDPFEDQVWEALFIVNESTHMATEYADIVGNTDGTYSPDDKRIILVRDGSQPFEVSTLAHELVHALQDQHGLIFERVETLDGYRANTALIEGDAHYVYWRYRERCQTEWDCYLQPDADDPPEFSNRGLGLAFAFSYEVGPMFVSQLKEDGGWDAVNDAYANPPTSTEQVIHVDRYPDETPTQVTVEDRSTADWRRMAGSAGESQTVGEAALYAMFWANGIIEAEHLTNEPREYNYSHPITDGWAGDAVVPYRNGQQFGYVFKTTWETDDDARQFEQAYITLLEQRGADRVRPGVYQIPDGEPFADAFHVRRDGRTVTIVNAPTIDELPEIHSSEEN